MNNIPREIIAIIKDKRKKIEDEERYEIMLKVFEDFIIPYLYHFLQTTGEEDDPFLTKVGNLYSGDEEEELLSSYMLTAVKRVCQRLKNEVWLGCGKHAYWVYFGDQYFDNKRNPFV